MNVKEIPQIIVVAIVGILVTTAVLVPILSTAVDSTREYHNNNHDVYAMTTGEVEISFSDSTYYVDGERVSTYSWGRLFISDVFAVYRSADASYIYYWNGTSIVEATVSSFEMEVVDNIVSLSYTTNDNTTTTVSIQINWGYYCANEGSYRMYNVDPSNSPEVFVNSLSDVIAIGKLGTTAMYSLHNGTVEVNGEVGGGIYADLVPVSGVMDVYSIDTTNNVSTSDIYFVVDDTTTLPLACIIVPYEIYGYKTAELGVVATILSIIPILVIMGLLVGIVVNLRSRS